MMRTMTRYRFDDGGYDFDTEKLMPPRLIKFKVQKLTEKGAWIVYRGQRRFVRDSAYKSLAYDTAEKAWNSYMRRKAAQVTILEYQLQKAKACLNRAKEPMPKVDTWMPYTIDPYTIDEEEEEFEDA